MFDLTARTAVVTGSSRGIGHELARGLRAAGATVVLNGRDAAALERARADLTAGPGPGSVHAVAFDVTDADAVQAAIERIETQIAPLDILVNNAGVQHRAPIGEFPDAEWNRLLATNLTSTFLLSRAVGSRMAERGSGKIVNICSLQSEVARPGMAAYAATKGAVKMLTKGLCADLGPSGVQVNGIGPGYIETELTAALRADPAFSEWVTQRTPARRWGRPADLVGALVFLCSAASDFVNGQIIYVDGGMLAVL